MRKPERGTPTFPYPVIQIKDVTHDGRLDVSDVVTMELPTVPERFVLAAGDVLFCARGTRNRSAVFSGEVPDAVAGTQFFVIKVRQEHVLPEYLAWYINQDAARQYLAGCTHGSYVSMIHKEALMELPVPVPPLAVQKQILAVHELALREQRLMAEVKEKRAELVSALCGEAVERFSTGKK